MKPLVISLVIILGISCGLIGTWLATPSYGITFYTYSWATIQDMNDPATGACLFPADTVQGQSVSVGL